MENCQNKFYKNKNQIQIGKKKTKKTKKKTKKNLIMSYISLLVVTSGIDTSLVVHRQNEHIK